MTNVETVSRDSRSYRQGLVLGLTMAEVFLLLVFALLIALAVLWNDERTKRKTAEAKNGAPPVITAADKKLLDGLKDVIAAAGAGKVNKAHEQLRQGRDLEPLSQPERTFVTEVRRQQRNSTPQKISDDWRNLTSSAQPLDKLPIWIALDKAVEKAVPNEKNPDRIPGWIERGIASEKKGEHDWPPIINLNEAKRRSFEVGKAVLEPEFADYLRTTIVELLQQRAIQYGVTIIEVIGHTDEQRIAPRPSNLDATLVDVVNSTGKVGGLVPGDNAGLGLARAVAVMNILKADERLKPYTVLPLSAGQLINVGDTVTVGGGGDDKGRRRIEIRLRRANPEDPRETTASGNAAR